MRIIIVGDGKMGSALMNQLSREGHDITVIDHKSTVLNQSVNVHDVIGIQGNGASYDVLMEAGVSRSDLVIAATSSDELNILCCFMARKLGARSTIARVRNPEYAKQMQIMREDLGLSMVVNPERSAAREIARNLRLPSALNIDLFAQGRVELIELLLQKDNPLAGKSLSEIGGLFTEKFLVCAVNRNGDVHIPTGSFVLREGDRIHFTASAAHTSSLFKRLGIVQHEIRRVMIAGGGRITNFLARQLLDLDMDVTIIEQDPERCRILCESLPEATVIQGDSSDRDLLNEEDIDQMDAFVALTGLDEQNIILSMYAAARGVDKVLTKIDHIKFPEIFEGTGIGSVISPYRTTSNQITRFVRAMQNSYDSNTIESLHKMVDGHVEAMEFSINSVALYVDIPLKYLRTRDDVLIACILRGGNVIVPGGNDMIKLGDRVIIVARDGNIQELKDILQ
ncbi:MAG: Trk system potassium transporter TrkA [Ruminococcaceae bacterium]|nr:Trk system potassium transporter TrkA [Oscillospiraceae bacterium]